MSVSAMEDMAAAENFRSAIFEAIAAATEAGVAVAACPASPGLKAEALTAASAAIAAASSLTSNPPEAEPEVAAAFFSC